MAPPGISDGERERITGWVEKVLATPEWKKNVERYDWTPFVKTGAELDDFVASEQKRVQAVVDGPRDRQAVIGARVFGGVLLALGVIAFVATIGVGDGWSASGPRLAPAVSSLLLIVLSAAFLLWPGDDLAEHIEEAARGHALADAGGAGRAAARLRAAAERAGLRARDRDLLLARGVAARVRAAGPRCRRRRGAGRRDVLRVLALAQRAAADRALGRLTCCASPPTCWTASAPSSRRENLLLAAAGVILGTLVGVLPGIGPALTIALLLPITFNFDDPVGAFILFAGIYAGGMYGGSTTSILLNTPGESSSVATAIEGFEMAKRGRGRAGAGDRRDRLLRGRDDRDRRADRCWPSRSRRWR